MMKKLKSLAFLLPFALCSCGAKTPSLDEGLLAYYPLDEQSGMELVGEGKDGVSGTLYSHLQSSPTYRGDSYLSYKKGIRGEALVMDGYSVYGEADDFVLSGNSFTLSAWIAPRAYNYSDQNASDDNVQAIISQYFYDGSTGLGVVLGYRREGKFMVGIGTDKGWFELYDEGTPLDQYQWNHVAATFDGASGELRLFKNGRIVNRMNVGQDSFIQPADVPFSIGKSSQAGSNGDCLTNVVSGLLDEVKVYGQAKTAAEIGSIFKQGLQNGEIPEVSFEDVWLQNSLTEDAYKPQYHGGPYENWMNEPHAPFFYNGVYHIFFQQNLNGPYFNGAQGICWGHLTSTDMVNWTPRKEVVVPTAGSVCPDGVWSGGSTIAPDGTPVLFFTAGDYAHPGLQSNQNIGMATPKDLSDPYLTEWVIDDELSIAQQPGQGRAGEFRDAHVYRDGDDYYLLVGSGDENSGRGTVLVYKTDASKTDPFHKFEYKGHLFDYGNSDAKYGSVWELPVLLPLKNEEGEDSGKFVLAISPAPAETADNNIIYWIGEFDKEACRFVPDFADPRRMDYGGNVFTGPSGFVDPNDGNAYMFSIMQSLRTSSALSSSGWAHNMGMVRKLYYDTSRSDLGISIIDTSSIESGESVELDLPSVENLASALSKVESDSFRLTISFITLDEATLKVRQTKSGEEYTAITIRPDYAEVDNQSNLSNYPASGGVYSGPLSGKSTHTLDVLVDRSMVEVCFDEEKTISARSYPTDLDALYLSFAAASNTSISHAKITFLEGIY